MRKDSELLKICSKYETFFHCDSEREARQQELSSNDRGMGMCTASRIARGKGDITLTERVRVGAMCSHLVEKCLPNNQQEAYLYELLLSEFNLEEDKIGQYVRMVYNAWIDKLESEGN